MIKITFPDGNVKEFAKGTTAYQIAESISPRLAAAPFSASALHYTIESLDEGWSKRQGHSQEVEEADLTNFCIDKVQAGLGCEDSWGRIARPEYQVPYADYEFTFILTPVHHNIGIQ